MHISRPFIFCLLLFCALFLLFVCSVWGLFLFSTSLNQLNEGGS